MKTGNYLLSQVARETSGGGCGGEWGWSAFVLDPASARGGRRSSVLVGGYLSSRTRSGQSKPGGRLSWRPKSRRASELGSGFPPARPRASIGNGVCRGLRPSPSVVRTCNFLSGPETPSLGHDRAEVGRCGVWRFCAHVGGGLVIGFQQSRGPLGSQAGCRAGEKEGDEERLGRGRVAWSTHIDSS